MAVRTFRGNWDDRTAENHRQVLAGMLKMNGIAVKGNWEAYRYNPPWTMPQHKTNEVAVEIDMTQ